MLLSILIPVYNWDIRPLVTELHRQLQAENQQFEIIIEDDASEEKFHLLNLSTDEFSHTVYYRNPQNLGRSKIRNLLLKKANYPYILLMDCDAGIVSPYFIRNYFDFIQEHENECFVTSGGIAYRPERPAKEFLLRWKYGRKKEEKTASERVRYPYRSFTPFNILATKSIFDTINFDENFHSYGHEDTFFGYHLQKMAIQLYHIDNPLYHDGLDNNEIYLRKVESSVENLARLMQTSDILPEIFQDIRLHNFYCKMRRIKLLPFFRLTFKTFTPLIRRLILRQGNLVMLDVYKLGKLSHRA